MKLKTSIQVLVYSNRVFIVIVLIAILILVAKSGEGKLLVLEALILLPFGLSVLFRKLIASAMLRKSNYPGVFFDVLQKMNMTQDLEISVTDELLEEIYNPKYATSHFLSDNNLRTEVRPARLNVLFFLLPLVVGMSALVFYFLRRKGVGTNLLFVIIPVFTSLVTFFQLWKKRTENTSEPLIKFSEKELRIPQQKIGWTELYDWNCVHLTGDRQGSAILINYYGLEKNIEEAIVTLVTTDTSKIEFLMLMTHFKGKYGKIKT